MSWQPGDAKRYRDRAGELRRMADLFSPENRAMLLNMATYYDGFALQAELDHAVQRDCDGERGFGITIPLPCP